MITIKNKVAIAKMAKAGQLLQEVFNHAALSITAGISTLALDTIIAKELAARKLTPKCLGYRGYRNVSCISVNDEVVHGVPSATQILKQGDLVKVDVCAAWQGYCADMARCYFVGTAKPELQQLVSVAQSSLDKGIAMARAGNRLSDISHAIQKEAESHGLQVVRDFAGHGIGQQMHEDPEVLNYGVPGKGPLLQPGMAFALEPMVTTGHYEVYIEDDGWTVRTVDKSLAAHIEDTIVITHAEPVVITRGVSGS